MQIDFDANRLWEGPPMEATAKWTMDKLEIYEGEFFTSWMKVSEWDPKYHHKKKTKSGEKAEPKCYSQSTSRSWSSRSKQYR